MRPNFPLQFSRHFQLALCQITRLYDSLLAWIHISILGTADVDIQYKGPALFSHCGTRFMVHVLVTEAMRYRRYIPV